MYYLPIQNSDIAFRLKCFLSFQSLTPAKSFGKPTEDTHQLLLSSTDPAASHSATLIERHVDPKQMMSDKKMRKRQSSAKQDKEKKLHIDMNLTPGMYFVFFHFLFLFGRLSDYLVENFWQKSSKTLQDSWNNH